ncbi:MAG: LysM peptidoglycan-binding domain-containing protein [Candidatus Binatia bacterium]
MGRLLASLLLLLTAFSAAVCVAAERAAPAGSCVDAILRRVPCSNPDEVCRQLLKGREAGSGATIESLFEFRTQDLGDGTEAYVFTHRSGADTYAYVTDLHFVKQGDRLVLLFDGDGVAATYATDRPRVKGRYQLERKTVADIPGLYRKREVETWFWTGEKYAKAYSRMTIDSAKDPSLNGSQIVWDRELEQVYKSASPSWTYTVKAGDTLSAIGKRFGASSEEIMRQNGVRSAGSLRIGQTLRYEGWKVNAR